MTKGLEALEVLKHNEDIANSGAYVSIIKVIEEELEVLEVIKPFLKNIRLEENEKGECEILIDVVNNDRPLVIARVNSKEEYDLLKEVLL